jgi:Flp pilus assembly protein TadG
VKILWKSRQGSQLVEFAFVLPVLLVLAVGIADLAGAFVLRDKLTNAAREGARIAIGQGMEDRTQAFPLTIQGVRAAVVAYLAAAVDPSIAPAGSCAAGSLSWTCGLSNGGQITIEREFPVQVAGVWTLCTQVTVSYPYSWTFGRAIRLLGSSDLADTVTISSQSVMRNLP